MGGCPEFRNSTVDVFDAAAKSVILGDVSGPDAANTAATGIVDAALTMIFDSFRTDELN